MRALRRVGLAVVLGTSLVAVAACGGAKFHYVNDSTEGNYFKVPKSWTVYPLTAKDKEGRPEALPIGSQSVWHVAFDSARPASLDHLDPLRPDDMVGEVQIISLSDSAAQQISQSQLREWLFYGVDPILNEPQEDSWELVSAGTVDGAHELTGTRAVINAHPSAEPDKWVTIDGSVMLDLKAKRVYFLRIRCDSQCYDSKRKTADEIVASWKVQLG